MKEKVVLAYSGGLDTTTHLTEKEKKNDPDRKDILG